jgi:cadmium resistance protein CadD (predicted permease)
MTSATLLGAAALAVPLFAATNIDDILVLVAYFADPRFRIRDVVIGQYLGIGALTLVSIIAALVAGAIPDRYIGLLGLVPIALGISKLADSGPAAQPRADNGLRTAPTPLSRKVLAVSAVTVSNGADNIGAYAPLFATRSHAEIAVIAGIFALMTAVWCYLAQWLVSHTRLGPPLRRYGHRVLAVMLIVLGLFILQRAAILLHA